MLLDEMREVVSNVRAENTILSKSTFIIIDQTKLQTLNINVLEVYRLNGVN